MSGDVCLILHAHVPCLRARDESSPGAIWLYHAIADCYLPLLRLLHDHAKDRSALMTVAISPTLWEALDHPWFRDGFTAWLEGQVTAAQARAAELDGSPLLPTAAYYVRRLQALRHDFGGLWDRDLSGALGEFAARGLIELVPSVSSQPILPLMATAAVRRAHITTTLKHFSDRFGMTPAGIWMPSCAVDSDTDRCLGELGVRWAVSDTAFGPTAWMPTRSPSGVTWFPRDAAASSLLGADEGPLAYRDLALDAHLSDPDRLLWVPPDDRPSLLRTQGPFAAAPALYEPAEGLSQARSHAGAFLAGRQAHLEAASTPQRRAVAVCAYPAELFGRVWFEGPAFLAAVTDGLADAANRTPRGQISAVTPSALLAEWSDAPTATPTASSWGEGGYFRAWTRPSSRWLHGTTRRLEVRLVNLATRHAVVRQQRGGQDGRDAQGPARHSDANAVREHRATAEALRHLMLAQSSDWHWLIRTGRHIEYALERAERHIRISTQIVEQLEQGVTPAVEVDVNVDVQLGDPHLELAPAG